MANTPYGRGPYGARRYGGWPGGAGRPYGIGLYGTGPYSRYGANVYDLQGRTGLQFAAHAAEPRLTFTVAAASSIVFVPAATSPQLIFQPQAVSGLVFSLTAELQFDWNSWQPCEPGAWQPAVPCEGGGWLPPGGCGSGSWTEIRLEQIP